MYKVIDLITQEVLSVPAGVCDFAADGLAVMLSRQEAERIKRAYDAFMQDSLASEIVEE